MLPDRMEYSPQVYIDVEEVISMVMDPSVSVASWVLCLHCPQGVDWKVEGSLHDLPS